MSVAAFFLSFRVNFGARCIRNLEFHLEQCNLGRWVFMELCRRVTNENSGSEVSDD